MDKKMISTKDVHIRNDMRHFTKHARGFTLLELMIAVLLGSIVIAVVGGLFLANTNTFRAVDDSSRMQENGRFALQTLGRIVRQAGFIPADVLQNTDPSKAPPNAAFPNNPVSELGATFLAGRDGTGQNSSDEITLAQRGAPGGQIVDCTGTPTTAAPMPPNSPIAITATTTPVINRFYVAPASSGITGDNSLWCDVTIPGTVVGSVGTTLRYELITGVESFQVLYGVAPNGLSLEYVTSANKIVGAQFNSVMSIQVALVLRGAERATVDKARTGSELQLKPFGDYDGIVNADPGAIFTISAADKSKTFRVLTSTINLRNRSVT